MSGSFVRSFIQHRVFAPVFTKHVSTALCTEIKGPGARPRLCPRALGRRAGSAGARARAGRRIQLGAGHMERLAVASDTPSVPLHSDRYLTEACRTPRGHGRRRRPRRTRRSH